MEVGETLMIILIIIVIIGFISSLFWSKHLHIDLKSFVKPGFKKLDTKFGIYCYTGKQGKGKTYSAIKFCLDQAESNNYKIITNVRSFAERNSEICIYMDNIFNIIDYCKNFKENDEQIMIFYDEIFTVLEKSGSLKKEILSFMSQMRKRKILFITTAQEWSEINITFRRYVRYQISCNMIATPFLKWAFVSNQINDGDLIKWDNDLQDFVAPTIQTNFSKGLKSVINAYDTYETIDAVAQGGLNKTKYAS